MRLKVVVAIATLIVSLSCEAGRETSSSSDGLEPRNSPVQVGEIAPDFALEDQNNRKVTLSSGRGSTATVLVFYRGYW